jgi:hypothetical protein
LRVPTGISPKNNQASHFRYKHYGRVVRCGGGFLTYAASEMSTKRYFIDNKDENAKPDGIIDEIIPLAEVEDIGIYMYDINKYVIGCDKPSPNLPHL